MRRSAFLAASLLAGITATATVAGCQQKDKHPSSSEATPS